MLDDRANGGGRSTLRPGVLGRLMVRHQPQSLDGRRSVSRVLVAELFADDPIPRPLRSRFFLGQGRERRLERGGVRAQLGARGDGGPSCRSGFASSF